MNEVRDYHKEHKEALDFAIKALEAMKYSEELPSFKMDDKWWDIEDALNHIKEILK